jgi:hypothetical protein
MRHQNLCLGGLVSVAALVGPWPVASAQGQTTASAIASAASDRPPVHTLRLSERQVLARFIPAVRARPDLRERAVALWRTHFSAEADAIRLRFVQEEDWRPAFADAAALVDDYLEASLLPRAGEFPAGEGGVWVESIDPRNGQRVRAKQPPRRRPTILAPADRDEAGPADKRTTTKRRIQGRSAKPVRR